MSAERGRVFSLEGLAQLAQHQKQTGSSIMKPGEDTMGEASQMLRDILKTTSTDKAQDCATDQQPPLRNNNNTLKTLTSTDTAPSPLSAESDNSDTQDVVMKSLLGASVAKDNNGISEHAHDNDNDNDDDDDNSNNASGDDTEVESPAERAQKEEDCHKENDDSTHVGVACAAPPSGGGAPPQDSKEAKRARVENILTSIRQSPQLPDPLTQSPVSDPKRQKRKQLQPQQHEVKTSSSSPLSSPSKAKHRKLECEALQKHILQLQRQLHAVKESVSHISTCSSDDEDRDVDVDVDDNGEGEDLENEDSLQGPVLHTPSRDKDRDASSTPAVSGGLSPYARHDQDPEDRLTSALSLCLNGKRPTREGAENKRYVLKDTGGGHGYQNGHLAIPRYQPPSLTSHCMSQSLKSDIIQAVKRAVDFAVLTVLEKHAGALNNNNNNTNNINSNQQPENNKNDSGAEVIQHPRAAHTKSPRREDDLHLHFHPQTLTVPRPRQEREALKEAVSNSQITGERSAELTIPFPDHLRFLERLSSHHRQQQQQLTDKAGVFTDKVGGGGVLDPLALMTRVSESSELIKPHVASPALPFPPHFPFSGFLQAAGLLPPLFPHPAPPPPLPSAPTLVPEPEQTEALPLVVSSNKKKRTKVTDTRPSTSPRGGGKQDSDSPSAAEQEPLSMSLKTEEDRLAPPSRASPFPPLLPPLPSHHSPYLPPVLPTSVAITNPSLQQSELFTGFPFHQHHGVAAGDSNISANFEDNAAASPVVPLQSSSVSLNGEGEGEGEESRESPIRQNGGGGGASGGGLQLTVPGVLKSSLVEGLMDTSSSAPASPAAAGAGVGDGQIGGKTTTLTPMHLRKAKLMFFYTRYPPSGVLKSYFPDVAFNKNNTAQLVKWFSNFREFYYIQMEKHARQAMTEGRSLEDLAVHRDGELFRQLNLHYNRNNHIQAPESFREVAETTLKEFFQAILAKKDLDSSWKKTIYKVIARLDEPVPDVLKSPNWMDHMGEA